ncbi:TatD family hydrolase [Gayadomonas joobiniege]|uniref:TatD family hydrolase n=1 Tax=Gayadomonas joobiniege TaxID=1234606 RepID=UPI00037E46B7|nr:TatD family hydrolase [Gayadomonas joobiniege]
MKPLNWFDAGVNLLNGQFDKDRLDVLRASKDAGIQHQLLIASHLAEAQANLEFIQTENHLFSTVGIHPHDAVAAKAEDFSQIEHLYTQHDSLVAIGECGLDYNRNYSPQEVQRTVFAKQLDIASRLQAPLYLHQRDAHQDFYQLIAQTDLRAVPKLVHCFTGNQTELEAYLDLGCYIGITGWVCDERRGQALKDLLPKIPLSRIILETDAPFLIPRNIQPKPKTRRNLPSYLPWIAQTIAEAKSISLAQVASATFANSVRFFNLDSAVKINEE